MIQKIRASLIAFALVIALPAGLMAQDAPVGTILIAHGGGPDWNAQVEAVAALVESNGPVEVSYLMGPGASANPFQVVAKRMEDAGVSEIVVVPLLVSSHSSHYEQLRYLIGETDQLSDVMLHHLAMGGIEPADVSIPIRLTAAIDDASEVGDVLAERALALADSPADQALMLMGHGPNSAEDNAQWLANLRPIAEHVAQVTGFKDVQVGLVRDDAPEIVRREAVRGIREIIELQHLATGRDVVVVPILISTGQVSREKFPADLAGLPVVYSGDALLPHPGLAKWVEARIRDRKPRAVAGVVEAGGVGHEHSY